IDGLRKSYGAVAAVQGVDSAVRRGGVMGLSGPNGCGKSNLLEALRWVMGANSAKAMRAGGMDDVIFAGSGNRPPRNHADVTLTIDNADRTAPAAPPPPAPPRPQVGRGHEQPPARPTAPAALVEQAPAPPPP
ncbi:AAA family ATPase, partial [Variovorax sp. 2RAF20]